ncbi:hypothetical protein GQ44DRAFT_772210 [Phaeosphaeriaceae sp. PMI808]|nr:hypothetical protein GQ44DRAFT_772210 [Phaeosphaeriaceae sp. PMI808]
MPNPNLQVFPLKSDEAEKFMRIRHETFKSTINKILYSRGEASQKTLDRVTGEVLEAMNKGAFFLKCVDMTNGEIIAAARWRHVKPKQEGAKERTWDEVEAAFQDHLKPYDESNPELIEALFDILSKHKREHLGTRPYYCLDTLATLQQHERRGAGSMLVRWGCAKADEAGVEAYLEASPMGAPMYARHGFERKEQIDLDLRKYGGDEVISLIPMLRPAKDTHSP